jgi:hypothetical protein
VRDYWQDGDDLVIFTKRVDTLAGPPLPLVAVLP